MYLRYELSAESSQFNTHQYAIQKLVSTFNISSFSMHLGVCGQSEQDPANPRHPAEEPDQTH